MMTQTYDSREETPELTLKGLSSCITYELYDSRVMTPESCIGSRECKKLLSKVGVGTR